MGCCGGPTKNLKVIRGTSGSNKSVKADVKPLDLRPASTKRVVVSQPTVGPRLCPSCGFILSIEYVNEVAENRGRCGRCKRVYSLQ